MRSRVHPVTRLQRVICLLGAVLLTTLGVASASITVCTVGQCVQPIAETKGCCDTAPTPSQDLPVSPDPSCCVNLDLPAIPCPATAPPVSATPEIGTAFSLRIEPALPRRLVAPGPSSSRPPSSVPLQILFCCPLA